MPHPAASDPPPAPVADLDLRFGRFRLLTATRQLLLDGEPAPLGARAFDLLALLARHRDRVVVHEEVRRGVWPGVVVSDNNLQVQVSALRKLLGPGAIATVARRGYRFTAAVHTEVQGTPEPACAPPVDGAVARPVLPAAARTDDLDIDAERATVTVNGRIHRLRPHTLAILLQLVRHGALGADKAVLMDAAWPGQAVSENALHVQIAALRKLLGPARIATLPNRGYLFNGATEGDRLPAAGAVGVARGPGLGNLGADDAARLPVLIGREDLLRSIGDWLHGGPALVTLCGPGGVGKTRLARSAALAVRNAWRDGAWWLDLASQTSATELPYAVAHLLRITLPGRAAAADELPLALRPLRLLLVLDNCEHLRDAVAALAGAILAAAPGVRLLATSRVPLGLPAERLLRLPPLSLPPADAAAQDLLQAEVGDAARLFAERARVATGWFALDERNVADVVEVCRQLDGLPLAIELAAARVPLLGVQALRDRLGGWPGAGATAAPGQHLQLLRGSGRQTQARHLSLQDALDWSHSLLSPQAQAVYRRVGAFVGGFTLALAQQVAGDERIDDWAVLELVSSLVEQSLISHDHQDPPRFHLLETARVHALARLDEAGETRSIRRRHAAVMRRLFDEAVARRDRGQWPEFVFADALMPELPNALRALQTAHEAAADDPAEVDATLALADVVGRLLYISGRAVEAIALLKPLEALAALPAASPGLVARWQRRLGRCGINGRLPNEHNLARLAAAAATFAGLDRRRDQHECLWMWAESLLGHEEGPPVQALLAQAQALEQDDWHPVHQVHRMQVEGRLHTTLRQNTLALEVYQRAREIAVGHGMAYQQLSLLCDVALALYELNQTARAVQTYREVVELARRRPMTSTILADGLMGLAASLVVLGQPLLAFEPLIEVAAMWRRSGLLLARGARIGWALVALGHSRRGTHWLGAMDAHLARQSSPRRELRFHQALEMLQRRHPPDTIAAWLAEGAALEVDALMDALESLSGVEARDGPAELRVGDDDAPVRPAQR